MGFCANCGAQQNTGAKFCPNCGQSASSDGAQPAVKTEPAAINVQSAKTNAPPNTNKENSGLTGSVKKELLQFSNTFLSIYLASFFLMKVQAEGGFKSVLSDMGDDKDIAFVAMLVLMALVIGATYFTVRVQGINKEKPSWVLGTLIVIAAVKVFGWTGANFLNFNWADWASEAVDLAQLCLLFAIYQPLNASKNGQV
jgi:hypothetical protein